MGTISTIAPKDKEIEEVRVHIDPRHLLNEHHK